MADAPVLLLDIDGVINANRPGWGGPPRKVRCAGFTIRWAPTLITHLFNLNHDGAVEARWCSTWCGFPEQLAELERAIGLRLPSAIGDRSLSRTWGDLKVEAAENVLAADRRLIWVDDDEVGAGREMFPAIAEAEAAGRALLIQPRSNRGMQPTDVELIRTFVVTDPAVRRG